MGEDLRREADEEEIALDALEEDSHSLRTATFLEQSAGDVE
jgi:hypothetical protein